MKIFGQLEQACFEQLSSDPAANVQGRVFENTAEGRVKRDSGTVKRAFLINDEKAVIGNDGTASNNVRIHRGGSGLIQDVLGDDITVDGSPASVFAQRSFRFESKTSGTLPGAANAGRGLFLTDEKTVSFDDGANWRRVIPEYAANDVTTGSTVTLATVTTSVVRLTASISTISMIPAGYNSQRVTLINRSGGDISVAHDSGATTANRIFTGTGANIVLKSNAALPLWYDATTQRWQVQSEVSGAAAGGVGVPNSSVHVASTNYTILASDDIILADASAGAITLTLPSAAGNLGKVITIEKIAGRLDDKVTVGGTINGITNDEIWAKNVPYRVVSDGTNWKTLSTVAGHGVYIAHLKAPFSIAALNNTTNVVLETMSQASGTNFDNSVFKAGNIVALFAQTVAEENGIYVMPATNITIAGTATGNENISTLANNSTLSGGHNCNTGEKVSLRFQTIASENGIYVIGATAGTTVRDTSQRHSSYVTAATLSDLVMYTNWRDTGTVLANRTTEVTPGGAHPNSFKFWRQSNKYLTTFTGAALAVANLAQAFSVQAPSNAKHMTMEICPFGGSGQSGVSGGTGGTGAAGATPFLVTRQVTPGALITVSYPTLFSLPGVWVTAGASSTGTISAPIIVSFNPAGGPAFSFNVTGAPPGVSSQAGGSTNVMGPTYTSSGAIAVGTGGAGQTTYLVPGGAGGAGVSTFNAASGGGAGLSAGGAGGQSFNGANQYGIPGGDAPDGGFGVGGGGGGGGGSGTGWPGRGGIGGAGYVRITWG